MTHCASELLTTWKAKTPAFRDEAVFVVNPCVLMIMWDHQGAQELCCCMPSWTERFATLPD